MVRCSVQLSFYVIMSSCIVILVFANYKVLNRFQIRYEGKGFRDENSLKMLGNDEVIYCQSSKGPFRIILNPKDAPIGVKVLKEMVKTRWFDEGDGVAFFRVNKVATQFGVKEKIFKFNWKALNISDRVEWRDPNPEPDKKKRRSWPRGVVYMTGGTHLVVVRTNGHHGQGKQDFESIVGRVPEDDMVRVFDNLYAYNDPIDYPHLGPGPDQVKIYQRGWKYLMDEFPNVDRITSCKLDKA